jgi:hypothetical protein
MLPDMQQKWHYNFLANLAKRAEEFRDGKEPPKGHLTRAARSTGPKLAV